MAKPLYTSWAPSAFLDKMAQLGYEAKPVGLPSMLQDLVAAEYPYDITYALLDAESKARVDALLEGSEADCGILIESKGYPRSGRGQTGYMIVQLYRLLPKRP